MLTDFYNIWHTVRLYWENMHQKSYWFAHLTYTVLLHYWFFFGSMLVALKRATFVLRWGYRLYRTVHLVCIIKDIVNYSVDKMVLVSLNLNEYHMPASTISVWTLYIRLQNGGFSWFYLYKLVIFICISTKVGVKVCILLFNSCVKLHSKICMHCWNMNKSWRGCFFLICPVDIYTHLLLLWSCMVDLSKFLPSMWCKKTWMLRLQYGSESLFVCRLLCVTHCMNVSVEWADDQSCSFMLCCIQVLTRCLNVDSDERDTARTSAAESFCLLRWFVEVGC